MSISIQQQYITHCAPPNVRMIHHVSLFLSQQYLTSICVSSVCFICVFNLCVSSVCFISVFHLPSTQSVVLNLDGICKPTSTWRRGATKHIVLCRHDRLGQNKLLFFQAKGEQKAMQTATNTPGQGRVGAFSTSQHYLGNSLSCLFGNDKIATTSASRV